MSAASILHLAKRPVPNGVSPDELVGLVHEMASECGPFNAVAFSAPAPAAEDFDGVLTKLPNLPSLVGMNLRDALDDLFHLPVTIENDATAAAIGENWIGASRTVETSICITLGTGIGGGIIIDGVPLRGPDGTGGEIGHICGRA